MGDPDFVDPCQYLAYQAQILREVLLVTYRSTLDVTYGSTIKVLYLQIIHYKLSSKALSRTHDVNCPLCLVNH